MTRRLWLQAGIAASVAGGSGRSNGPGLDSLRLETEADRDAFRRWFTFLAEVIYFTSGADRPSEIVDCAALLRFAYREALRKHDSAWCATVRLPLIPAIPSVSKYAYPHTPIGPAIFRCKDGSFAQFADAETLACCNAHSVGREIDRAQPGDLLFYRRPAVKVPFHSMIFVGRSQVETRTENLIVYHTGSDATIKGEIRRRTLQELMRYPDPQWQPRTVNPFFLGVYRWEILLGNELS